MSRLLEEPDHFIDAMMDVLQRRADAARHPGSRRWDEE